MAVVREGDLLLLLGQDGKRFLIRVQRDQQLHTHRGMISHNDLIGQPWGCAVASHLQHVFLVLKPSIHDLIMNIKRVSQIVYPKESGYMLLKMNIGPGSRVIEAGSGSGAFSIALAHAVRPHGRVYSYEWREEMAAVARRNLEYLGLSPYVDLKVRDIAQGFDEREVDALFLDVREPWLYLAQVQEALAGGGFFGAVVPTTNQLQELVRHLEAEHFAAIEVQEILLREYKPVPDRLRPADRMVGHTGYMVFARHVRQPIPQAPATTDASESAEGETSSPSAESEPPMDGAS